MEYKCEPHGGVEYQDYRWFRNRYFFFDDQRTVIKHNLLLSRLCYQLGRNILWDITDVHHLDLTYGVDDDSIVHYYYRSCFRRQCNG